MQEKHMFCFKWVWKGFILVPRNSYQMRTSEDSLISLEKMSSFPNIPGLLWRAISSNECDTRPYSAEVIFNCHILFSSGDENSLCWKKSMCLSLSSSSLFCCHLGSQYNLPSSYPCLHRRLGHALWSLWGATTQCLLIVDGIPWETTQ